MESATLRAVINNGGALRVADLSRATWDDRTDFRNAFLDNTVALPAGIYERMGEPCQWLVGQKAQELEETEFLSIWRWWLDQDPDGSFIPSDLRDTPLPFPDRLAELGLTECKWNQPFGRMPDGN